MKSVCKTLFRRNKRPVCSYYTTHGNKKKRPMLSHEPSLLSFLPSAEKIQTVLFSLNGQFHIIEAYFASGTTISVP